MHAICVAKLGSRTLTFLSQASGIEDFRYKSNKALQKSLDSVEKADDPFFNRTGSAVGVGGGELGSWGWSSFTCARLVRLMTTRCMEEALYFATGCEEEEDWKHFGLVSQL